ncbi:MAG: hypothetical protein AABZ50_05210 [Pseudomonadota bacterium]
MPYQDLEDGLYLISQPAEKNGVRIEHFGILDIGNTLQHPKVNGEHPVVVHQTPPHVRADWLGNTGNWSVLGRITDAAGAMQRLKAAFANPHYDLFGNNCEHFARFVAHGERRSNQIFWGGVGIIAAGVLAVYLFKGAK